jgi:POT family proton-dependent oligopeptide transporter
MARLKLSLFQEQPRAFSMVFLLEIWERFGYYTVQGILTLFFIRYLGFGEGLAYDTFGAFVALVYGMIPIGGYLGDKVLGTKRTLVLGLFILALGYLFLALADKQHVFFALGLICVGNGVFKANPSSLLSKCYEEKDPRLHSGFTLYYMAINIGSIFALFVGPTLSNKYGYSYAYFASFLGILSALLNYMLQRHSVSLVHSPLDRSATSLWQWAMILLGVMAATLASAYLLQHVNLARQLLFVLIALVVGIYFFYMSRESTKLRKRMLLAFILMLEGVIFFTLYQQMPTSINLFAVNHVHPSLFGFSIDPQSFQVLNPIWIVSMSPFLAIFYGWLNQQGYSFPIPYKFALGMTCCGVSFLLLYFSCFVHDDMGRVSFLWLVASYFFQSLGELLVSALGVAMIAELVPKQMSGFVMGMWFLTSSVAGFIGAKVATYTALPAHLQPGIESLMIYTKVFAYIGGATLMIALLLWCVSPQLSQLMGNFGASHDDCLSKNQQNGLNIP